VGGFAIVALITLAVGFTGWQGSSKLKEDIDEVGSSNLPIIYNSLSMKASLTAVKAALRTLLSQGLSAEEHERQYARIAGAGTKLTGR